MIGTPEMNGYIRFTAPKNPFGVKEIFYNEFTKSIQATWNKETVKGIQNIPKFEIVYSFILQSIIQYKDLPNTEYKTELVKDKEKAEPPTNYDTLESVFFSKYDLNDISENPFALWDAIGFLKGIKYLAPTWCPGSLDKILKRLYEMQEYNANRNREWLKEVFR